MLNYSILLKKISKLIGNTITEDMDLLKVIGKVTSDSDVKTIINSVNDNQIKNKLWLIDKLKPFLSIYTDPKIVIAAGWHGLLAHLLDDKNNITSFDIDDKCAQIKLFDNVHYKKHFSVCAARSRSRISRCCSRFSSRAPADRAAARRWSCL